MTTLKISSVRTLRIVVRTIENTVRIVERNHAQFEMIHPFLDGNGRMGRLLITLFLADKKILSTPCFYMSAYLQSHSDRYYETIGMISKDGDWNPWIEFFLNGVIEHCTANVNLLINMTRLYEESKEKFVNATNSSFAINSLDYIFANPIFSIPGLRKKYKQNLSQQVASHLVNKFTAVQNNLILKLAI
ncbi:Fic family protein [Parasutterella muris]|uniref:Fido domain-containing protein n=1 Tax=Parasutterella muris TaxID=2565572 RepID=A0A6L6YHY5_9BURK|nr:Fic family protein [Parasutterella muris]MVX57256.1 hypothetical protein [Parasutterella muris]